MIGLSECVSSPDLETTAGAGYSDYKITQSWSCGLEGLLDCLGNWNRDAAD